MKNLFILILIFFVSTLKAQDIRSPIWDEVWFSDANYDCTYTTNELNNCIVDTVSFEFTVHYKNILTLRYMSNGKFDVIRITYGYVDINNVFITINTVLIPKISNKGELKLIPYDYNTYPYKLTSDNMINSSVVYPKGNNKFICKVAIKNINIPSVHIAYICFHTVKSDSDEFDETKNDLYFGKLKKEDAIKILHKYK